MRCVPTLCGRFVVKRPTSRTGSNYESFQRKISAELQPPPRTTTEAPHQHDMSIAPAVKSLLSSSGATSPRPAAPPPMLLSPNSFTATPISITKLLPSIPTSAPAAPTLVSLSHDLPKKVPRSSSYQSAPTVSQSDELVPTPLATPAGKYPIISVCSLLGGLFWLIKI